VVKQALEQGYEVTAIIRNPYVFDVRHPNLKIIKGDVLQPSTFEKEMIGKEAAISCLGRRSNTRPTIVYSEGIQNIISSMNNTEVKRLICVSAIALDTNKEMGFLIRAISKVVLQKILKGPYDDTRLMENKVESTKLDWTIVRPPMLKNTLRTAKYRIALHSHVKRPLSISRGDVAHYLLSIIHERKTFKAKAEIAD